MNLVLSAFGLGSRVAGAGLLSGGMPSASSWGMAGLTGLADAASAFSKSEAIRANAANDQQSAYLSAADEMLNAQQAFVSGQGQQAGLRAKLASAVGQRTAIGAASGVDVGGQGIGQDNNRVMAGRALTAAKVVDANTDIEMARHRMNALAAIMKGNQIGENASRASRMTLLSGGLGALLGIGKILL